MQYVMWCILQKEGKEGRICGLHLKEPSNWESLYAALLRNWPSNAPLKDADTEVRHSNSLMLVTGSSTWHLMADK